MAFVDYIPISSAEGARHCILGRERIRVSNKFVSFGHFKPPYPYAKILLDSDNQLIKLVEGSEGSGFKVGVRQLQRLNPNYTISAKGVLSKQLIPNGYYRLIGDPEDPFDLTYAFERSDR